MKVVLFVFITGAAMAEAQTYTASAILVSSVEVLRLADAVRQIEVLIVPS